MPRCYVDAARQVGRLVAEAGMPLISGAGRDGLMGAACDGALERGGVTIGVIPRFMVENGWHHRGLTRLEETADMHARKERMAALAHGVIAMPGGCGTLEELLEIITWRQLGLYRGNIVILNTDGYYDPLLEMLSRAMEQGFMHKDNALIWTVAATPEQAVEAATAPIEDLTISSKY